jgi:hypothetical protein
VTFCLTCNADKHPCQKYTKDGIVEACPTCGSVFSRLDDEAPAVAIPAPDLTPPPVAVVRPATAEPTAWSSLLDQMRTRLAFCDAEIAKRDGYLAERDMLRKMLATADGETKPATASVFTN